MNLRQLQQLLDKAMLKELPGIEAQIKLGRIGHADLKRFHAIPAHAIKSAVLILLFEKDNQVYIPFIVRSIDGRVHSGQIAFPGGRFEEGDQNLQQTALREAAEEIGINPIKLRVLGQLTPIYIPPSNYLVQPFVAVAKYQPVFQRDDKEVAAILELPMLELLKQENITNSVFSVSTGEDVEAACFSIDEHLIWGATAMILSEFIEIIHRNND